MTTLKKLIETLQSLEEAIDSSAEITDEMVKAHFDSVTAVDDKVDALAHFIEACKFEADALRQRSDAILKRARSLENTVERCQNYAIYLLKAFPNMEYRGKTAKLSVRQNPPSLKHSWEVRKYALTNVVPNEDLVTVPDQFLVKKEFYVLNTDALKAAVQNGPCEFARLERGERLHIQPTAKKG